MFRCAQRLNLSSRVHAIRHGVCDVPKKRAAKKTLTRKKTNAEIKARRDARAANLPHLIDLYALPRGAYLSRRETAIALRVSLRCLEDWGRGLYGNGPPFVHVGNKCLYQVGKLIEYVEARTATSEVA